MAERKIAVLQKHPDEPIPTEVLADSIVEIAAGVRKLRTGRLNDRALILLIQHATVGVNQREIKAVLDGIDNLEREYVRKKGA